MYPNTPIVYLVSGSKHLSSLAISYEDLIKKSISDLPSYKDEIIANEISTLIVPNSLLSYNTFNYIYADNYNLAYPIDTSVLSEFKVEKSPLWNDRSIDIGVFVSSHDRIIKNSILANKILESDILRSYKKLIVGDNYEKTFSSKIKNVKYLPMISNKEVIEKLKNVKVILVCSLFDASPNICIEAICCGCKILLTKNVGNSEKYDPFYIIDNLNDIDSWITKIDNILTNNNLPELITKKYDIKPQFVELIYKTITNNSN